MDCSDLVLRAAARASGFAVFDLRTDTVADVTDAGESSRLMDEHCFIPDHLFSSSEKRACIGDLNTAIES